MANNQSRRIAPTILQTDVDSFSALQAITGYAPANAAYAVAAITTARQNMEAKQAAEAQTAAALASARDDASEAEWAFHNAVLGAKTQVEAQFGENSNEIQALGRKKKSDYARPSRRQSNQKGPSQ